MAALLVCVGHLIGSHPTLAAGGGWHTPIRHIGNLGYEMVLLFLMVSAFSLFYSEDVRRLRGSAATGFRIFMTRRAWRLLPTYYAALLFGALVIALVPTT